MPIRLNSFILPDHIIKKMEDQIDKTRNTKIEHGFNICKYNDHIIDKDECTGSTCEIKIKEKCSNQDITPKVGDYHTHPRGSTKLSLPDMRSACHFDFKCIGSIYNSIKCFVKKSVPFPEGCSIEIENIIIGTEEMNRETDMLKREGSMLDTLKNMPNIDMDKYRDFNNKYDIKVRKHNENVSYLIKRKDMVRDTYFKEIIIK